MGKKPQKPIENFLELSSRLISDEVHKGVVDTEKDRNYHSQNTGNPQSQKDEKDCCLRSQSNNQNIVLYDYVPIYGKNQYTGRWASLDLPLNTSNVYYKNVRRELACYLGYRNLFRTSMTRSIGDEIYKKCIGCLAEPSISTFPDFLQDNKSTIVKEKRLMNKTKGASNIDKSLSTENLFMEQNVCNFDKSTFTPPVPMTPNVSLNDLRKFPSSLSKTTNASIVDPILLSNSQSEDSENLKSCDINTPSPSDDTTHQYIILATDGFWDSCKFEELISFLQEIETTIKRYSESAQANFVGTDNGDIFTEKLHDSISHEEMLNVKRKMLIRGLSEKHVEDSFKYFGLVSDDAFIQVLY